MEYVNPNRLGKFHYLQSQGKIEILNYLIYKDQWDFLSYRKVKLPI